MFEIEYFKFNTFIANHQIFNYLFSSNSRYLGVNISKEDRGKVIECGRKLNSDIQVYQMVVNPDAFKLDFINIS